MLLPRAYPSLPISGVLRRVPEDFEVDERLADDLTGSGEHLFVRVEKRGLNTAAVAQMLADAAQIPLVDVSYAGMKDRWAVTRQWFSLCTPDSRVELPSTADAKILESERHIRKLRRGQLAENRFRIVLREVVGDRAAVDDRIAALRETGAPNYFGAQRFGYEGANVAAARDWLESSRPRRRLSPHKRGILLSAARSWLFNTVLAERVRRGDWNQMIDGDVPYSNGPDADGPYTGGPTGPMWGRGRNPTTGTCAEVEAAALAPEQAWLEPLEHVGLNQQRRRLELRADQLSWDWDAADLELTFGLGAGCYATTLLAELGRFDAPPRDSVAAAEPAVPTATVDV